MTTPTPPLAAKQRRETSVHGQTLVDDYFWLRERENPEVLAYIEAENQYAAAVMADTAGLQDQLYAEMRSRIKEDDDSVPVKRGDYFYYTRMVEGGQYPLYCRKHGGLDAAEEILLDQNALAAGLSYCRVGAFKVSPDHRLLAYSIDDSGAESYTIYVKDLASGELLPDRIPNTYYGVEWANDNRTLFYNVLDAAMRPYQLMRHAIGGDPAGDELVYHETDESFFLWISRTTSEAFLVMSLTSTATSEIRVADADDPAEFRVVEPRRPGHEYNLDHHGDRFFIVSNDGAKNFRVLTAPVADPVQANWVEWLGHRPAVYIDDLDSFKDHIVIYEREQGSKRIRISRPDGGDVRYVEFPEPVYTFTPGPNAEWDSATLRFTYTSLITPSSVVDYGLDDGSWTVRKQEEIPSGYDPALYESERVFATAPDGTQVPMSLVYRRGLARDGGNPALLYGYGSYGFSVDPGFSANRLSLLERGFVFAIAHIRGGSELGREWYEHGKLEHKKNTFSDFIACAEHLIAAGHTSSRRLGIMGGSAGGLLMGAVVNARPDLFQAVIAKVPFVDVINTMLDPTLPLTVIEYEQWGNPNEPEVFEHIKSYSPYDNLAARDYPHILATAGLNDPRVSYWEPAKWVARLRSIKTDQNLVLLKTNTDAGHGGASGRYDYLKEIAFEYAFLFKTLGVSS
ncbi:MAG TPA: S9 family peptidase [Herpetosiphonaceae bacterium]|nr:S9 family peptidase [Herpetosiphonaceae bacterium]